MFVYDKTIQNPIYHKLFCPHVIQIPKEQKKYINSLTEENNITLEPCDDCSFLGLRLKKEQNKIKKFTRENNIKIFPKGEILYIETTESLWKLKLDPMNGFMDLYHQNAMPFKKMLSPDGTIQREFHLQHQARYTTILDFIQYINHHDNWKANNSKEYKTLPKKTKKERKKYNKKKFEHKKRSIQKVYYLIDYLEYKNQTKKGDVL